MGRQGTARIPHIRCATPNATEPSRPCLGYCTRTVHKVPRSFYNIYRTTLGATELTSPWSGMSDSRWAR